MHIVCCADSEYTMLSAAAENVLAEIDEGLRRTRDVAVAFPCETDIDVCWCCERDRADPGDIADDHVEQECDADAARDESHDGDDLIGLEDDIRRDVRCFHLLQHDLPEEGAFLEHDEAAVLDVLHRDRLARGERAVLLYAAYNLTACHRQEPQIGRGFGDDDDAKVQLIALELFADGNGAFLVEVDVQMGIAALETRKNLREEIGAHHRRDADLDRPLLQLLVVVDFKHSVLDAAERDFDAPEEDSTFGGEGELFLTPIKELDAKLAFQFLDGNGDVRLRNAKAFGGTRDVFQAACHLEILQLP